jgi:hypothetical protein
MAKPIQYQILAEARLLIDDSKHWCEGKFAVGKSGRPLIAGSPRALQHCAVSAILLAARRTVRKRQDADRIAESIMSGMAPVRRRAGSAQEYLWTINDRHGHTAILDLFDTALAMY